MSRDEEFNAWESAVKLALKTLRFGSVELVVHDGRVIQIERREKIRFQDTRSSGASTKLPHDTQTSPIPYGKAS